MALILGIDPGSRVTGYGIVRAEGNIHHYVASGCIRTSEARDFAGRLAEIFDGVRAIMAEFAPHEVAIEKVFLSRSADSALKLGQARGAAVVATAGVPCFEYEARKVKQAVVGTGSASKQQVQQMVRRLLHLPGEPQSDAADALAIALCHCQTRVALARIDNAVTHFSRGRLRR